MGRIITAAAIQMQMSRSIEDNIQKADRMVREAAKEGAQVILLPELFERPYFCQERCYDYYAYAKPVEENDAVLRLQKTAKELSVVIPVSFYERDVNCLYNSVAMIDADGSIMHNSAIFCLVQSLQRTGSYTGRILTVVAGHGNAETANLRERTALIMLNSAVEYATLQLSTFHLIFTCDLTCTAAYAGSLVKIECFSCHCYTSPLH